jgi:hypothetical protein
LTDQTGGVGLLWIKRQLQYQAAIFDNISLVPVAFPTVKAANLAAYHSVYDSYHGFFVQQIFKSSFDAAPEADAIFRHMNVPLSNYQDEEEQSKSLSENTSQNDDDSWIHHPMELEDNPVDASWELLQPENPVEQVWSHLRNEWMKFQRFVNQCGGGSLPESRPSRNILDTSLHALPNISKTTTAKEEISAFLAASQPFLEGLDKLISELNMNDPTKT